MSSEGHSHITANVLGQTVNIDTLIQIWLIMAIILMVALIVRVSLVKQNMGRMQFVLEGIYDMWHGQIASQLDAKKAKKFLPFISGIFLFFLLCYWSPLLPWKAIMQVIPIWPESHGHAWHFESPILDLNVPFAIAFISLVVYLMVGLAHGKLGYLLAYFGISYHHGKVSVGLSSIISGLIEWMDVVTRPITLSLRIYANVLAGEALAIAVFGLMPIVAPVGIYFFEFAVGFLQSFIFAMLSLIYIKIALTHGED